MKISLIRKCSIYTLVLGMMTFSLYIAFMVMSDNLKTGLDLTRPPIYLPLLLTIFPSVILFVLTNRMRRKDSGSQASPIALDG